MKIIYNKEMKKLILEKQSIWKIGDDILKIDDNILKIEDDVDIYSDYYFYSNRIDRFFTKKSLSFINYLNIAFYIWWVWISWIKQKHKTNSFYFVVQYDDWTWFDDNINYTNEGFFIKLFSKKGFNEYFWERWIIWKNKPYISIYSG